MSPNPETHNGDKLTPEKLRRNFYRIALDWLHLNRTLPTPLRGEHARRPAFREYGHPAEWASDLAARIANVMTEWHAALAEERNETPPQTDTAEKTRVIKAWQYLEPRFDHLHQLAEPEAFDEIREIHWEFKRRLGYTNPTYILPTPCPNDECGHLALQRRVAVGTDLIECGACGYTVHEQHYPLFARMMLDLIIEQSDQPN